MRDVDLAVYARRGGAGMVARRVGPGSPKWVLPWAHGDVPPLAGAAEPGDQVYPVRPVVENAGHFLVSRAVDGPVHEPLAVTEAVAGQRLCGAAERATGIESQAWSLHRRRVLRVPLKNAGFTGVRSRSRRWTWAKSKVSNGTRWRNCRNCEGFFLTVE